MEWLYILFINSVFKWEQCWKVLVNNIGVENMQMGLKIFKIILNWVDWFGCGPGLGSRLGLGLQHGSGIANYYNSV